MLPSAILSDLTVTNRMDMKQENEGSSLSVGSHKPQTYMSLPIYQTDSFCEFLLAVAAQGQQIGKGEILQKPFKVSSPGSE